ncbi:MAG: methyltransferase [Kofleriaceae bacterium]
MITSRQLAGWAGTDRIPLVRARLPQLRAKPITPVNRALRVYVAGDTVGGFEGNLVENGRASVAVLPIGESLIVCDRADAPIDRELVRWPDDSSFHLLHSIPPGTVDTWLDLGCGSAVAPLVRRRAHRIVCSDLNPRALVYAQHGARLSNARIETLEGDLATVPADLITCNAPIPSPGTDLWRSTDDTFLTRLLEAARAALNPGGTIVIHSSWMPDLPGDAITITYTPTPPHFGITWWRPHTESRHIRATRLLTADHPHVHHTDRDLV